MKQQKPPTSIKTNNETFDKKSYKEAVKQQYVVETSPNIVNKPKQSSQIDNTGSLLSSGVKGEKFGAKLHPISSKEGVPRQSPLKSQQTIYSTKNIDQERKINKSTIVNSSKQSKIGHDCLDDVISSPHLSKNVHFTEDKTQISSRDNNNKVNGINSNVNIDGKLFNTSQENISVKDISSNLTENPNLNWQDYVDQISGQSTDGTLRLRVISHTKKSLSTLSAIFSSSDSYNSFMKIVKENKIAFNVYIPSDDSYSSKTIGCGLCSVRVQLQLFKRAENKIVMSVLWIWI